VEENEKVKKGQFGGGKISKRRKTFGTGGRAKKSGTEKKKKEVNRTAYLWAWTENGATPEGGGTKVLKRFHRVAGHKKKKMKKGNH